MFIPDKKLFFRWWLIAALIYLIFSAVITWQYGTDFLIPMGDDSAHHIKLAENLIKYQTFSLDGLYSPEEPKQPLAPTNFLTPGYAFWLALIYLVFNSFVPAIFIGALVFAVSVSLTYLLAQEITGNNKIAFWSALIFMIEPLSIYHSGLMFTEQLFVPIFLLAVYFFIRYIKTGNKNFVFSSLFIFSLSVLIRPIIFYLLPVLVLIVFFKELKISIKHSIILGTISFVLTYSIIGVWLVRNKTVLNTWQVSSNTGAILFGYHYEPLMRHLGLVPGNQKILGGGRDIFSVEYNKILKKFVLGEITKHKVQYLEIRAAYAPLFFLSSGYNNIVSRFTGVPSLDKYFRGDLVSFFAKGDINGALRIMFRAPKIAVLLIGFSFWFLITALAIIGFWRLLKTNKGTNFFAIIFISALIIYFNLVTTPLITARYRLPVNPFIFIFAVSGFYFLKEKIKQWV